MLTVNIAQHGIEDKVRSIANALGRAPEDIILATLATSLGEPELLSALKFPLPFETDEYEAAVATA